MSEGEDLIETLSIDTGKRLCFLADTPMQAMNQLIYYFNLSKRDAPAWIQVLGERRTLTVDHGGQTSNHLNLRPTDAM